MKKKILLIFLKIIAFLLATAVLGLSAGLGLEYVLVKGPSESIKETFVLTMLETRRFTWVPELILSADEVAEIKNARETVIMVNTDLSMIEIAQTAEEKKQASDIYGTIDEDGDGLILEEVKGKGFQGYMLIVLDPLRVFVGKPAYYGGVGLKIGDMVERYDAIAGMNAGGFLDDGGQGLGGQPAGLTIVDYEYFNAYNGYNNFAGFDANGILHVGRLSSKEAKELNIRYGVTFGPVLVSNGQRSSDKTLASGINPRTAIGQRADGAVLMLVIDGRQAQSIGCTYGDLADIMLEYGAVNACNMDGGSSTCLYMNGDYVNSASATTGVRPMATGFLVSR